MKIKKITRNKFVFKMKVKQNLNRLKKNNQFLMKFLMNKN